jgi:hypothetical protein
MAPTAFNSSPKVHRTPPESRVSATGDVDGDGTGDLIIGAPRTGIDGAVVAGRSYVVLGGPQQAVVDLADVAQGTGGFALDGIAASDQSGFSVSGAGDVNLDGLADLIVGAPFGGDQSGRSFASSARPAIPPSTSATCSPAAADSRSMERGPRIGRGGL